MSKVSVFKYSANGNDALAKQIIENFIVAGGFVYNEQEQAYLRTEKPPKAEQALNVVAAIASAALTGTAVINSSYNGSYGFKYTIENGIITIKAYLQAKNGYKDHISRLELNKSNPERVYCDILDNNVFKPFLSNNMTFIGKEKEKIKDGKMSPIVRALLIVLGILAVGALAIIILL